MSIHRFFVIFDKMFCGLRSYSSQKAVGTALSLALIILLIGLNGNLQPALAQSELSAIQSAEKSLARLSLNLTIVSIDAEISQANQTTQVSVRNIGSSLEELEFRFPLVEFAAVEQAVAEELKLDIPTIHRLIRYRIDD